MLSTIGRAAIRRIGGSSQRVLQLQRVCVAQSLTHGEQTYILHAPQAVIAGRRLYSDEAAPKVAKKTPAKKAVTTKPAKKAVKPKAKKVKKVVKKKKVAVKKPVVKKKKELTEEQKAKVIAVKARDALKALKETALLKGPDLKPAHPWTLFSSEFVKARFAELQGKTSDKPQTVLGEISKEASAVFKNLSVSEREHYNHIVNQNRASNEAAYAAWVASFPAIKIREANAARKKLKKIGFRTALPPINDPRLPKRPLSGYLIFTQDRHASGDLKGITLRDLIADKTIEHEWNGLSESEKKHYQEISDAQKLAYKQAIDDL